MFVPPGPMKSLSSTINRGEPAHATSNSANTARHVASPDRAHNRNSTVTNSSFHTLERSRGAGGALAEAVQSHRQQNDDTFDDLLPERGDIEQEQAVVQHADNEATEDRAAERAPTAGQRGTPNDHGSD